MMLLLRPVRFRSVLAACLAVGFFSALCMIPGVLQAQEFTPEMLDAASQQTGLSREELLKRYQQQQGGGATQAATGQATAEPGRTSLEGIDDARPFRDTEAEVVLPYSQTLVPDEILADLLEEAAQDTGSVFYGDDFFSL
ncbi:MAG: hypothetical protein QNL91_00010, partial [Candidatus Krumholzibacteria bacterium]|nr:hypothetical protein [Candidatus Krumholzibacteria bacterium]